MRTRITHRLGNDFDQRNPFLLVTLGAISLQRDLAVALAKHAPPTMAPAQDTSDAPVLDVLLGLLAFSRAGIQHLESALRAMEKLTAGATRPGARPPRRRAPRDLLL